MSSTHHPLHKDYLVQGPPKGSEGCSAVTVEPLGPFSRSPGDPAWRRSQEEEEKDGRRRGKQGGVRGAAPMEKGDSCRLWWMGFSLPHPSPAFLGLHFSPIALDETQLQILFCFLLAVTPAAFDFPVDSLPFCTWWNNRQGFPIGAQPSSAGVRWWEEPGHLPLPGAGPWGLAAGL